MVTLICGIPNAGKTSYSARYANVIHFDYVKGTCKQIHEKIINMVSEDPDVCVEGVYARPSERMRLAEASKSQNVCVWLDTPTNVCLERERVGRKRSEGLVLLAAGSFEPPTFAEGWDEIIVIRGENDVQRNCRQVQD